MVGAASSQGTLGKRWHHDVLTNGALTSIFRTTNLGVTLFRTDPRCREQFSGVIGNSENLRIGNAFIGHSSRRRAMNFSDTLFETRHRSAFKPFGAGDSRERIADLSIGHWRITLHYYRLKYCFFALILMQQVL